MNPFKTLAALAVAAALTLTGVVSAQAATSTVARKAVVVDSKIKVGVTEKERGFVDRKAGTFEKER